MSQLRKLCTLAAIAVLLSTASLRAATLEEIEKVVTDNWEKISSMTYDMEMNTEMGGQGFSMKSASNGKCEMVHKGGKWFMRCDMTSKSVQSVGGNETKTDSVMQSVCDGDFMYTMMDNAGQKMAMKTKADNWAKNAGGKQLFETLKEGNTVKVLPDDTVDGVAVYVVEATPKQQAATGAMTYYFTKDIGMVVQMITKGPDGKVMTSMKVKNVKTGASVPDDHFVFKAPDGVQVQDMTKQ